MRPGPKPRNNKMHLIQRDDLKNAPEDTQNAPDSGPRQPPEFVELEGHALKMWEYLTPILIKYNLFSNLDVMSVVRYCELWARWWQYKKFIDKNGLSYPIHNVDKEGNPTNIKYYAQYPEVGLYKNLDAQLHKKEVEFGLTPNARTRIPELIGSAAKADALNSIDDILKLG